MQGDTRPNHPKNDLGLLVDLYRVRTLGWRDLLTLFLPGVAAVLAPLAYGMAQANYAYSRLGPVAAQARAYPWFLLATAALGIFVLLVAHRLLQARSYVAVYQHGLRLHQAPFTTRSFRWEQLSGVSSQAVRETFLSLPLRTYQEAELLPSAGKPVRLDRRLARFPELISRLKAALYPRLMPRLCAAFEAGQWVFFGPVAIHKDGLQVPGRRLPWKQVGRVDFQGGFLVVTPLSPAGKIAAVKIPLIQISNPELLVQIIQQAVSV